MSFSIDGTPITWNNNNNGDGVSKFNQTGNKKPNFNFAEACKQYYANPETSSSSGSGTIDVNRYLEKTRIDDGNGNLKEGLPLESVLDSSGRLKPGWTVDSEGVPHYDPTKAFAPSSYVDPDPGFKDGSTWDPGFVDGPTCDPGFEIGQDLVDEALGLNETIEITLSDGKTIKVPRGRMMPDPGYTPPTEWDIIRNIANQQPQIITLEDGTTIDLSKVKPAGVESDFSPKYEVKDGKLVQKPIIGLSSLNNWFKNIQKKYGFGQA